MMDSFISLNEGEKDVQHPISSKESSFVANASDLSSPLFQLGEDISNNQSVSEIAEEIWKDHRDHINDVLEENVNSVNNNRGCISCQKPYRGFCCRTSY